VTSPQKGKNWTIPYLFQTRLGQSLILKYLMINLFLLLSILLKCDLSGIYYYALQLPANVFVVLYTYITTL
jgi:hypothetical protein